MAGHGGWRQQLYWRALEGCDWRRLEMASARKRRATGVASGEWAVCISAEPRTGQGRNRVSDRASNRVPTGFPQDPNRNDKRAILLSREWRCDARYE